MIITNDLVPNASGLSHLGIDGSEGGAFNISSLAPFGNIHFLSGIIHDPLYGQSGVIRFNQTNGTLELSVNGGLSFQAAGVNTTTLQQAYENGANVSLVAAENDLSIQSTSAKFILSSDGDYSTLEIQPNSGPPGLDIQDGDFWVQDNAIVSGQLGLNSAQRPARSLGIGTIGFNTGSGIVNIRVGSGIAQFSAVKTVSIPTGAGTAIPFDTENISDLNYRIDDTGSISGVKIMSQGLYKCSFTCSYDNTGSTARHIVETDALLNAVTPIRPSSAFSYHRNTSAGKNTGSATFLFQARSGDVVNLRVRYSGTATTNSVVSISQKCSMILEKIGSRRDEAGDF